MTIETKYNIGDKVWIIFRNKARCEIINNIRTISGLRIFDECGKMVDVEIKIEYCFLDDEWVSEENCFPTKEELLKSL